MCGHFPPKSRQRYGRSGENGGMIVDDGGEGHLSARGELSGVVWLCGSEILGELWNVVKLGV